ncbi:receptor activity-modifying protein 1-like [Scyliorhinus canicula]|uniref:receptor activity-modifying protein 1-like n=1 Tax=Scyliorhinus canicula TaxID=7830 RepID=UPI0018F6DE38|nr:receptor activity-modifying protein 1-like [Scyliorhinus canicula]
MFCIQIIACGRLILALLLAPTLVEAMSSKTNLSQLNIAMESGSTTVPGSYPTPASKPESTMGYAEEETFPTHDNNSEGILFHLVRSYCGKIFEEQTQNIGQQQWCNWTAIASFYSDLTSCSEHVMEYARSYWPNEVGESFFILVHSHYFKDCNMLENQALIDPPENIVLGLVIAPICIIPIMVMMVIWCSKNTEANAKK